MVKMYYILIFGLFVFGKGGAQTLDEYLKLGAENNPGLKASFKSYESSLEKVNQVKSLPSPNLDFGYFISPIETRMGPQNARIGLMQMFPWKGTFGAKEKVAVLQAKANYELFENQKQLLFLELRTHWYGMQQLQLSVKVVGENLKILKSLESLASSKMETGSRSGMVDVLRIQMEAQELENNKLLLQDKLALKKVAFNNLLNRAIDTDIQLPEVQDVLEAEQNREQYSDSIRVYNNEIRSLQMKKEAFDASSVVVKKQGLPMLGIGLSYFLVGERTDMTVPGSGRNALMPMMSVSLPVYRKKFKAQLKETELMSESVSFAIENKQNMLETRLNMQWVNYDDANRRIQLYNEQNLKAKQILEVILNSYTNSGKDFEEVLRIQRMMLGFDLKIILAVHDKNLAVANILSMY